MSLTRRPRISSLEKLPPPGALVEFPDRPLPLESGKCQYLVLEYGNEEVETPQRYWAVKVKLLNTKTHKVVYSWVKIDRPEIFIVLSLPEGSETNQKAPGGDL